jgi:hypothetical protein
MGLQRRRNDPFLLRPRPVPATLRRRDNLNRLRHRISPSDSPRTSPNKSPAQGVRHAYLLAAADEVNPQVRSVKTCRPSLPFVPDASNWTHHGSFFAGLS